MPTHPITADAETHADNGLSMAAVLVTAGAHAAIGAEPITDGRFVEVWHDSTSGQLRVYVNDPANGEGYSLDEARELAHELCGALSGAGRFVGDGATETLRAALSGS